MALTVEEFAKSSVAFLRAHGELRPIATDLTFQRLVVGNPSAAVSFISLKHALNESIDMPRSEQERVMHRRYWSSIQKPPENSLAAVFKNILPRVRDRAWFSAVRKQLELEVGQEEISIEEFILPHDTLNDELSVHLAFELPTSVSEIGTDRIDAWDTSFAALYAHAKANLLAKSKDVFEELSPGIFVSSAHDGFDASRLVLPEIFQALKVKGAPVAMAPTHDLLFVTGDQDESGLTQIADWAEESLIEPRSHTAVAFRLEKNIFRPWLPAPPHSARPKMKLLAIQTLAAAYSRQKELLEAAFDVTAENVLVATMRAFRIQGGEVYTACAWTDEVEAVIPKTDRIDFVRNGKDGTAATGKVWSASFEIVQKMVGDLMHATTDFPPRFRVKKFPSETQLAAMAKESEM